MARCSVEAKPDRQRLAQAIAETSLIRGRFTLRSGRESSYYLDKYRISSRPDLLGPLADVLAEELAAFESDLGLRADRLAGAELGGVPFVTALSLRTGRPCLFVRQGRKEYGTGQQVEGLLEPGMTAILVEDVVTTGATAVLAVDVLHNAGGRVLGVLAVVDRQDGAAETFASAGLPFRAAFTRADLGIDQ